MALLKDWDDLNKNGRLGDWCFFEDSGRQYFAFRHPRDDSNVSEEYIKAFGAGSELTHIPICTGEKVPDKWLWDGNKESPTISPSVDVKGIWHGFIRAGVLVTA